MFYARLNQLIDKVEQNLDAKINYSELAKSTGINLATLQKIFPLIAGISLSSYIRNRRLTLAGKDLAQSNLRIIDIAMKYGYTSSAAFSRAFYNFHGILPSAVKTQASQLRFYPKLIFTRPDSATELNYEIISLPALKLFGLEKLTNHAQVGIDAPQLFIQAARQYPQLPHPDFGLLDYLDGRDNDNNYRYYILWRDLADQHSAEFVDYQIPAARWLKFRVLSQDSRAIQNTTNGFYKNFLPTCDYQLRPEPDLEYYHDGITELLIPIC